MGSSLLQTVSSQFGAFLLGARQFDACQFGALHFDAVPVRRDASLARCQFGAFHFGAFSNFVCVLIQLIQYSMHFCFIVYVIYLLIISTRHRYSIANLFIAGVFVCLVHTFINHFRTIFIREDQGEVITSD